MNLLTGAGVIPGEVIHVGKVEVLKSVFFTTQFFINTKSAVNIIVLQICHKLRDWSGSAVNLFYRFATKSETGQVQL